MRVKEGKWRADDHRIPADGVLLAQVVRHDRVQRDFGRRRLQGARLKFAQDGRRKMSAAAPAADESAAERAAAVDAENTAGAGVSLPDEDG